MVLTVQYYILLVPLTTYNYDVIVTLAVKVVISIVLSMFFFVITSTIMLVVCLRTMCQDYVNIFRRS